MDSNLTGFPGSAHHRGLHSVHRRRRVRPTEPSGGWVQMARSDGTSFCLLFNSCSPCDSPTLKGIDHGEHRWNRRTLVSKPSHESRPCLRQDVSCVACVSLDDSCGRQYVAFLIFFVQFKWDFLSSYVQWIYRMKGTAAIADLEEASRTNTAPNSSMISLKS